VRKYSTSYIPILLLGLLLPPGVGGEPPPNFFVPRGDAYYYSGLVVRPADNPKEAIEHWSSIIGKDPTNAKAYYNRGYLRLQAGQREGAIKDLKRALYQRPKGSEALADHCLITWQITQKLQTALLECDESIRQDEKNPRGYYTRGLVKSGVGKAMEAMKDFSQCIALDQQNPACYYNRGLLHVELGALNQAIADLSAVLHLDRENALAFKNRGNVHMTLGDPRKAI